MITDKQLQEKTLAWYVEGQRMGLLPKVAISLKQPWAWLVAEGFKDMENRPWYRSFTGPALIHTGKTVDEEAMQALASHLHPATPGEPVMPELLEKFDALYDGVGFETGGLVGIATFGPFVVDHASPWFMGPYAFPVSEARSLPFLPWRGMLGFFPVDVVKAIP